MEIKGKNWTIKINARFILALGSLITTIFVAVQHFIH